MTYEDKLQKIVSKLKDERELTRKGHKTKITFDDESFTKISISDTSKVLLKLQDDEKALKVLHAYYLSDPSDYESYKEVSDDDYSYSSMIIVEHY